MATTDLYSEIIKQYNHSHERLYTSNGLSFCYMLSAMYGLAFFTEFRKAMDNSLPVPVSVDAAANTCTFHHLLQKMQNTVLYRAITAKRKLKAAESKAIKSGYDVILKYLEDWLRKQQINPQSGRHRSTYSSFLYTGFENMDFRQHLSKHQTIVHQNFQLTVCPKCGEPGNDASKLDKKSVLQVEKDLLAMWSVDHQLQDVRNLLCGDFIEQWFSCSKCDHPKLYKLSLKEPIKEFIINIERPVSSKFQLQQLKSIPLVDFELKQHEYECTHFIYSAGNHFTLHVIDWTHNVGWTLDSLSGSKMRQVSLQRLQGLLQGATVLFLRKTKSKTKPLETDLNHFQFLNYDTNTLINLLKVCFIYVRSSLLCLISD